MRCLVFGFVCWVVWYVWNHQAEFKVISQISLTYLVWLYIVHAIFLVGNGLLLKVALKAFDIRMDQVTCLALSAASTFVNQFLPGRGGLGLRALYLSKMYQVRLLDFVAIIGATYLIHIVTNGLVAIGGIGMGWGQGEALPHSLFVFFVVVTIAGIVVQVFNYNPPNTPRSALMRGLLRISSGWQQIRLKKGVIIQLWMLTVVQTVTTICQTKLAFEAVSIEISWSGLFVYTASNNLAVLVGITPGGFGIVESIGIYLGRIFHYSTGSALIVQGLIRAVVYSSLLLTGSLSLLLIKRRLGDGGESRLHDLSNPAQDEDNDVVNLHLAHGNQARPVRPS